MQLRSTYLLDCRANLPSKRSSTAWEPPIFGWKGGAFAANAFGAALLVVILHYCGGSTR